MTTTAEIARFLESRSGGPPSLDDAIRWRAAGDTGETEALLRAYAARPDSDGSAEQLLVQWLGWAGRSDEARQQLEDWLLKRGAFEQALLTKRLGSVLSTAPDSIETRYVLHKDAMQSLGTWQYLLPGPFGPQRFLTKIMHEAHVGNELLFYERILPLHPGLHRITPSLIDLFHLPCMPLTLITMTMVRAHDALTLEPEGFIDDASIYLGLKTVRHRLERENTRRVISESIDQLWHIALRIEDGALSDAERALKDAQDKLSEALQKDTSDEELQALIDDLKRKLKRLSAGDAVAG